MIKAKWIWAHTKDHVYNETIVACRSFKLGEIKGAKIKITADSFYRLFINGEWIADGPCRSWPEYFQYDQIAVDPYLQKGTNEIRVIARHYGVGDFHGVCQRPGLLLELEARLKSGKTQSIVTDKTWDVAIARNWVCETPKTAIQMEPAEMVDARLEDKLQFRKASEICGAHEGPWKNLMPRDVALLARRPFSMKRFIGAKTVRSEGQVFCVPVARLCHPGIVPSNGNVGGACGMATEITVKQKTTLQMNVAQAGSFRWTVSVDGAVNKNNRFILKPGRHFILALADKIATKHLQDKCLGLETTGAYTLSNPLDCKYENPWAWICFKDYNFNKTDLYWMEALVPDPEIKQLEDCYAEYKKKLLRKVKDHKTFFTELGSISSLLASKKMFVEDTVWAFQHRQVQSELPVVVKGLACISDNAEVTTVEPSRDGDVELCYDLGEQNLGNWHFDLEADEDVTIDMFAVEHIFEEGRPQHTLLNRNGFRYITKKGRNQFTSFRMRSGRYLFITLRNMKNPVYLRHVGMMETTYPVGYKTAFQCSDPNMERIWDISERTVKLCMTDTYLDCPLYEQTLWVGDARNESLFGYLLFGAQDIALRCIRLAGESLKRYPMVGCQVPSTWDCMLSAWSFLWGISVWEYYWQTGDKSFLAKFWPMVTKNLEGALSFINTEGLFSAPHWNMFDWSNIDQNQETVLHNSMFFVGAMDAAVKCADVLGKKTESQLWRQHSRKLAKTINRYWNPEKKSYPDSIHNNGQISPSICQHTSFLSLLYDIADKSFAGDCLKNTIKPQKKMIRVGSPFAIFYLYECWEKLGLYGEIFNSIRENYIPMLHAGATTVWECFPSNSLSDDTTDGGPTRSHCHAWSSAPVYFISRIILGIKQTQPGGVAFQISPWINDLQWAQGTVMSNFGPIRVSWKRDGKKLLVDYQGPKESSLKFVVNDSHKGLTLVVNGKSIKSSK